MKIVYVSFGLVLLTSCSTQLPERFYTPPLKENNYIENRKGEYELHLNGINSTSEIKDPTGKRFTINSDTVFAERDLNTRPYYTINTDSGIAVLSNRHIYFKHANNFRDIGGLKTKDGLTVKWGLIYRSDNLSKLRKNEFEKFEGLGIKTVFDLRTANEVYEKNDHLPQSVQHVHQPIVQDSLNELGTIKKKVIKGDVDAAQSFQFMTELYTTIIADNIPQLRSTLQQIFEADTPVLYHCSAGKDRTGIITALILSILKVDRQTIVNEYLMSDYYRCEKLEGIMKKVKVARIIKPKLATETIQNLMGVDERYLNAAFNVIDTKFGGIDNYIKNQLQIDDAQRQAIINKYTYSILTKNPE
ncbi:protein-tyrosine-phosphatase [Flavobacterium sp. Sd200]|uniref:tyrosine-protein phosphatase n=1 Tax=Flavobacterium sp. Sd200 TaxID=2692211 RepID=UPI00136C609D|nr:tyrosine-protein phosphatase [Flavobacterium sp. Sd200]MXN90488.1 protein-tyrosine-phosphatase [Flavobacterium sp. Sd200]